MHGNFEFQMNKGKDKIVESDDLRFQVLEELTNDPKGRLPRGHGQGSLHHFRPGQGEPRLDSAQTLVRRRIYSYIADPTGRLNTFTFQRFGPAPGTPIKINPKGKGKLPPQPQVDPKLEITYMEADDMAGMFNSSYHWPACPCPTARSSRWKCGTPRSP